MESNQLVGGNAHRCSPFSSTPGKANSILPAGWHDLNDLYQLEKSCFGEDAHGYLDMLVMLTFPGYIRMKALIEGQIAGFVIAEQRRGKYSAWIDAIGVAQEYRRQGIAKALLLSCERQLGALCIRLYVRCSNLSAIGLYKQSGYLKTGIRHRYYLDKEDALVMEKNVDIHSK